MPSANLDLVRSICAAWERGDFSSTEWAHPEIEFVYADGPSPGSFKGLASVSDSWREFLRNWQDVHMEMDECCELDDRRVLVLFRQHGRGKTSGLEVGDVQARAANVFYVRDEKVTRLVLYLDRERALADLGLAPEASSTDS